MQTRMIGSLKVSLAGLGCASFGWWIDEQQSLSVVGAALDNGITFFDCADEYGEGQAEEFLGRALGSRRKDVTVITKFAGAPAPEGVRPASAAWVRHSCEESLRRLNTDYIDLYMLHHPDPDTPIEETLEVLSALKSEGKIRELACSNVTGEVLLDAAAISDANGFAKFSAIECGYSLLDRTAETGLVRACEELGVPLLPYFPLASGMLTGKYRRDESLSETGRMDKLMNGAKVRDYFPALFTDRCFDVVEALERYAQGREHSLRELALAWVASRPWIGSVISGATSPQQVEQNTAALTGWVLTEEDVKAVEAITTTEHAYTWIIGGPDYSKPPAGTDISEILDPRVVNNA